MGVYRTLESLLHLTGTDTTQVFEPDYTTLELDATWGLGVQKLTTDINGFR